MHWLLDPITKHYVDFSGRATRQSFWMFVLFHTLIVIAFVMLGLAALMGTGNFPGVLYVVFGLFIVGTFLPGLAISVRRLHDAGFSGWLILIGIIPYLGSLILLVLYCLPTKVAAPVAEEVAPASGTAADQAPVTVTTE